MRPFQRLEANPQQMLRPYNPTEDVDIPEKIKSTVLLCHHVPHCSTTSKEHSQMWKRVDETSPTDDASQTDYIYIRMEVKSKLL